MIDPDLHPCHVAVGFNSRNTFLYDVYRTELPQWRQLTAPPAGVRFAPAEGLNADLSIIWRCVAEVYLMVVLLPGLPADARTYHLPVSDESLMMAAAKLAFVREYAAAHPDLGINLEPFNIDWLKLFPELFAG